MAESIAPHAYFLLEMEIPIVSLTTVFFSFLTQSSGRNLFSAIISRAFRIAAFASSGELFFSASARSFATLSFTFSIACIESITYSSSGYTYTPTSLPEISAYRSSENSPFLKRSCASASSLASTTIAPLMSYSILTCISILLKIRSRNNNQQYQN